MFITCESKFKWTNKTANSNLSEKNNNSLESNTSLQKPEQTIIFVYTTVKTTSNQDQTITQKRKKCNTVNYTTSLMKQYFHKKWHQTALKCGQAV